MSSETMRARKIARNQAVALLGAAAIGVAAAPGGAGATEAAVNAQVAGDLSELSIEELANVEVTSVSKKPESLSAAPASVFVITNEDIVNSGALSLPEVLRLAPNLQVARLDTLSTVITARGFNSFETANKMLVLVDGRSVYSPLFSGVFWETQNPVLADLDRIEVISGPGGTLWGANAVNGVINVISKDAFETQGGLVRGGLGDRERAGTIRYGGRFGDDGAWRVYGLAFERKDTYAPGQEESFSGAQVGFRTDWVRGDDAFTVQGDAYDHRLKARSNLIDSEGDLSGANILGRWSRRFENGQNLQIQAYADWNERNSEGIFNKQAMYDIQVQHNWALGRHDFVWGGGYRLTDDEFINQLNPFVLDPVSRTVSLGNVFAQDEVALSDDLRLIAGLKLEHSSYTGLEVLPNLRLAWQAGPRTFLWAAASRAVRTPSRIERDLVFPGVIVNGTFEAESVNAFELGYRGQPLERLSLSATVFYNRYDDLRTNEYAATGGLPIHVGNGMEGETYGVEAWGAFDAASWWRLSAGASYLHKDLSLKPGVVDLAGMAAGGNDPEFQILVRSQMALSERVGLDVRIRAVDDLPAPAVPGYVEADASLNWRINDRVTLSLSGFNLLDAAHPETGDPATWREVRRRVHAGVLWSF